MASFPFELVSPERLLFTGEVESVVVPGTEGEFTVLKDHAPLMSTLKPGIVTIVESTSKQSRLFVRGGFADVNPAGLTLLADSAVPLEDMTSAALETELASAARDLAEAPTDEARRLARETIDQLNELRVALSV